MNLNELERELKARIDEQKKRFNSKAKTWRTMMDSCDANTQMACFEEALSLVQQLKASMEAKRGEIIEHRDKVIEATIPNTPCEDRQKGLVLGLNRFLKKFDEIMGDAK